LPAQCAVSSGWQQINCCHINVCYTADFALTGVSAPPAGMAHALPDHLCGQCWLAPPPFRAIRAGFVYDDFSRALILPIKHGDALQLTPVFGAVCHTSF
jgi:predicted amidophosphoribosyltransferase